MDRRMVMVMLWHQVAAPMESGGAGFHFATSPQAADWRSETW
jgi:hypothetical protein